MKTNLNKILEKMLNNAMKAGKSHCSFGKMKTYRDKDIFIQNFGKDFFLFNKDFSIIDIAAKSLNFQGIMQNNFALLYASLDSLTIKESRFNKLHLIGANIEETNIEDSYVKTVSIENSSLNKKVINIKNLETDSISFAFLDKDSVSFYFQNVVYKNLPKYIKSATVNGTAKNEKELEQCIKIEVDEDILGSCIFYINFTDYLFPYETVKLKISCKKEDIRMSVNGTTYLKKFTIIEKEAFSKDFDIGRSDFTSFRFKNKDKLIELINKVNNKKACNIEVSMEDSPHLPYFPEIKTI